MSSIEFWKSTWVKKSRKPHYCLLCGINIPVGSRCSYEKGVGDGYFNSYYLCERCRDVIDGTHEIWLCDNELADGFLDGVVDLGMIFCPRCHECGYHDLNLSEDGLVLHVECDECDLKYDIDVSADALINKYIAIQKAEKQRTEDYKKHFAEFNKSHM